jgi:hypothetical protein
VNGEGKQIGVKIHGERSVMLAMKPHASRACG